MREMNALRRLVSPVWRAHGGRATRAAPPPGPRRPSEKCYIPDVSAMLHRCYGFITSFRLLPRRHTGRSFGPRRAVRHHATSRPMKTGCAEGRSPFAGSMRVPLRYNLFPFPGYEAGHGDGREGFSAPCYSWGTCLRGVADQGELWPGGTVKRLPAGLAFRAG